MIVILTGGIKNIGDFLIADRAKRLLKRYVDDDIYEISRFEPLKKHMSVINKAKALILCGGPAYAKDVFEGIYRLDSVHEQIEVPIIPFGLGWSGKPFGHPEKFAFSRKSLTFLKQIHEKIDTSSCRDIITKQILHDNSIENVVMTGCPVWYDLNSIGTNFPTTFAPKKIVITTPASPLHLWLNTKLVYLTTREFPESRIYLSYHRGIRWDKNTTLRSSIGYILMALLAKLINRKVIIKDVAYNLENISFYDNCDFHIGFRVHAHLYFLSKRLPSLLINEDGRGEGMVKSLDQTVYNVTDSQVYGQIKHQVQLYKSQGLDEFKRVKEKIDSTFVVMKDFLTSIIKNDKG